MQRDGDHGRAAEQHVDADEEAERPGGGAGQAGKDDGGKNEIDDQQLIGLTGILKISHVTVHGLSVLNLDGFAPAARWHELSPSMEPDLPGSEVA